MPAWRAAFRRALRASSIRCGLSRFVDNVYDYMHAADVLVTKPGGLTTAEALVARIPMVLSKPLPGQEERNARFLTDAGAAVRAAHVDELPAVLERLLARRERTRTHARGVGARPASQRSR